MTGLILVVAASFVVIIVIVYKVSTADKQLLPDIIDVCPERLPIAFENITTFNEPANAWLNDGLYDAMAFWNSHMGLTLFVARWDPTFASTTLVAPFSGHEEAARLKKLAYVDPTVVDGLLRSATLRVNEVHKLWLSYESVLFRQRDHTLVRALAHELGHILGLAHDDNKDSVMYYRALNTPDYGITDKDQALVKQLYGPTLRARNARA